MSSSNTTALFEVVVGPHSLTQLGNAERFFETYGQDVLYCPKIKQFYVWDGSRWAPDEMLIVRNYMMRTVRAIIPEGLAIEDKDKRDDVISWAMRSESDPNIRGALEHVKTLVAARYDEFDQDIWLLNFENGTLDLRTDEFRESRREDRITKSVPYEYDDIFFPDCPRWKQFLAEIFPPPYDAIIPYLQRAVGYSLTGNTEEHCLWLLRGDGRNGKSVFVRTLQYVLGDYASQADWQTFSMKKNSGLEIREDIARLAGARFVSAVESAQHSRMAENIVKAVTGGDRITARHLYKGSFEFQPQFKLWLASNYEPKIVNQDEGIWSRIRYIPFTVTIPAEKRDRDLAEKLKAEAPGILHWARQGLRDYLKGGLKTPEIVLRATATYRNDSDQLNQFLTDCTIATQNGSVPHAVLYAHYTRWVDATGERYEASEREFNLSLKNRGIESKRITRGMVWLGISIAAEESTERLAAKERTLAFEPNIDDDLPLLAPSKSN